MPGCALTCNANGRRWSPGTRCLYCLHYRPTWWGSSLLILEPFWALSYHRYGGATYLHIGGKANSPSCPHKHPSSSLLLCPLAQTKKAVLRQCPMISHYGLPLAPLNYVRTLNSPQQKVFKLRLVSPPTPSAVYSHVATVGECAVLHAEHLSMSSGTGISTLGPMTLPQAPRADLPPFVAMCRSGFKIPVPLSHPMVCVVLGFRFRSFVTAIP
jgi:hypothetical protein